MEKPGEIRIVPVIEHNETRIHRDGLAIQGDRLRIGMAAGAGLGFIQCHIVLTPQQPGSGKPGDAGADNGDPWFCSTHFWVIFL